jgi:hypothetical protein
MGTRCTEFELTNHREPAMWTSTSIRFARGCLNRAACTRERFGASAR